MTLHRIDRPLYNHFQYLWHTCSSWMRICGIIYLAQVMTCVPGNLACQPTFTASMTVPTAWSTTALPLTGVVKLGKVGPSSKV